MRVVFSGSNSLENSDIWPFLSSLKVVMLTSLQARDHRLLPQPVPDVRSQQSGGAHLGSAPGRCEDETGVQWGGTRQEENRYSDYVLPYLIFVLYL